MTCLLASCQGNLAIFYLCSAASRDGISPGLTAVCWLLFQGNDFRLRNCRNRTAITFYRDLDIGYPAVAASRGEVTMSADIFCKDLSGEPGL
jgi:hypothetical protein